MSYTVFLFYKQNVICSSYIYSKCAAFTLDYSLESPIIYIEINSGYIQIKMDMY